MRTLDEMFKELGTFKDDPEGARAWYGSLSDEERQVFQVGVADMMSVAAEGMRKMLSAMNEAMASAMSSVLDVCERGVQAVEETPGLREKLAEYAKMSRDAGF
jgi:hypothetical protein